METSLKQLREQARLTQQQAADLLQISLRSYKSYENDPEKKDTVKYRYLVRDFSDKTAVDETHGILAEEDIRSACLIVFADYPVEFCYLFGSYAKGKATEESDVDLLISTDLKGLRYYGLVEQLRNALRKKADVLEINQLQNNTELIREILRDGVKIYG
ncbi:MAG: nucleotidyltransferase domain-containing protein [Lachnospiraceae bacterium]|nr:nucleotidyltransferase domain-containing protein [Lachnospiraceae bacterium]